MTTPNRRVGDSPLGSLHDPTTPWWAKMALDVTFWLGPTAIVAAVFLSMWAGWLPSPITDTRAAIWRVENSLTGAVGKMEGEVKTNRFNDESGVRLLVIICRNTARTDIQAAQCNDYWKR